MSGWKENLKSLFLPGLPGWLPCFFMADESPLSGRLLSIASLSLPNGPAGLLSVPSECGPH